MLRDRCILYRIYMFFRSPTGMDVAVPSCCAMFPFEPLRRARRPGMLRKGQWVPLEESALFTMRTTMRWRESPPSGCAGKAVPQSARNRLCPQSGTRLAESLGFRAVAGSCEIQKRERERERAGAGQGRYDGADGLWPG